MKVMLLEMHVDVHSTGTGWHINVHYVRIILWKIFM